MQVINETLIDAFIEISGKENVLVFSEDIANYGSDETGNYKFLFDILIKPSSPNEIAEIFKLCNKYKISITPRGGGSGVTGGALPIRRGIILSLERLNKIISINKLDGFVIAESGVITNDLCNAVEESGLYFPVVPGSSSFSFIGGNVAENAGSVHTCKYGDTAKYVLNLEVVLPNGDVIWTGANVAKNSTGLNLTQIFAGSEGILGVITKVVYRLVRKPKYKITLLASFERLEDACTVITLIKQSDVSPSAVELICDYALKITNDYLGGKSPLIQENTKANLLIELNEISETALNESIETVRIILEQYAQDNILAGYSSSETEKLWKLRDSIGAALTHQNKSYRDIDVCVPLSFLYSYITYIEFICEKNNIPVVCFGHALDGNMHTMLLQYPNDNYDENIDLILKEIYAYAISIGGVISGEHGIGFLQKQFMNIQFPPQNMKLMKEIKQVFDPNGILNPGKVL
jgi:glycolate oxidase